LNKKYSNILPNQKFGINKICLIL